MIINLTSEVRPNNEVWFTSKRNRIHIIKSADKCLYKDDQALCGVAIGEMYIFFNEDIQDS